MYKANGICSGGAHRRVRWIYRYFCIGAPVGIPFVCTRIPAGGSAINILQSAITDDPICMRWIDAKVQRIKTLIYRVQPQLDYRNSLLYKSNGWYFSVLGDRGQAFRYNEQFDSLVCWPTDIAFRKLCFVFSVCIEGIRYEGRRVLKGMGRWESNKISQVDLILVFENTDAQWYNNIKSSWFSSSVQYDSGGK